CTRGRCPPGARLRRPRLIGARAATDMSLTGRTISAREAHGLGLVTRLIADEELAAGAEKLLDELRGISPEVLRLPRSILWRLHANDLEHQLDEVEHVYLNDLMRMKDAQERVRAVLEKREPAWQGR